MAILDSAVNIPFITRLVRQAHVSLVLILILCVRFMVFDTTLNNIPVILWQSVLLKEKTGVPGENH